MPYYHVDTKMLHRAAEDGLGTTGKFYKSLLEPVPVDKYDGIARDGVLDICTAKLIAVNWYLGSIKKRIDLLSKDSDVSEASKGKYINDSNILSSRKQHLTAKSTANLLLRQSVSELSNELESINAAYQDIYKELRSAYANRNDNHETPDAELRALLSHSDALAKKVSHGMSEYDVVNGLVSKLDSMHSDVTDRKRRTSLDYNDISKRLSGSFDSDAALNALVCAVYVRISDLADSDWRISNNLNKLAGDVDELYNKLVVFDYGQKNHGAELNITAGNIFDSNGYAGFFNPNKMVVDYLRDLKAEELKAANQQLLESMFPAEDFSADPSKITTATDSGGHEIVSPEEALLNGVDPNSVVRKTIASDEGC